MGHQVFTPGVISRLKRLRHPEFDDELIDLLSSDEEGFKRKLRAFVSTMDKKDLPDNLPEIIDALVGIGPALRLGWSMK